MIIWVHRRFAPEWCSGKLATAVGDDLIDVHVELGPAAGHPDVQGKHVLMLAREDFVASANDQVVALVVEPFAGVVRSGRCFLQDGVGGDHLARD